MSNPLDNIAPQDFAQVSEAGAVADTDLLPILHDGQARKVSVGTLLAGAGGVPEGFVLETDQYGQRLIHPDDNETLIDLMAGDVDATTPGAGNAQFYASSDGSGGSYAEMSVIYNNGEAAHVSIDNSGAQGYGDNLTDGVVHLFATGFIVIDASAAPLIVVGLPSTDPGVAGQLYTAGAPGADDPKALMVSGGTAP